MKASSDRRSRGAFAALAVLILGLAVGTGAATASDPTAGELRDRLNG
jgi:hypothetical protein